MSSKEFESITEIENNISSQTLWDYCPVEILLIIFGKLDATSLRCCSTVNRRWNEIAIKSCETRGLWQELAEDGIVNQGVALHSKSTLCWKDIYYNSLLWDNVQQASITKTHETENSNIKTMHVYKDNIIVVNDTNVEYYNTETFECVNVVSVLCEDFQETNDMVLVANSYDGIDYNLTLFHKMHNRNNFKFVENHFITYHYSNSCEIIECLRWLMHNNCCYIIDRKHVLWEAHGTNEQLNIKSLAKYYGCHSISHTMESTLDIIHVIDKDIYVSLKWGDLIEVNKHRSAFQKVRAPSIPTYYSTGPNIFKRPPPPNGSSDKFSALINVPVGSGFLEEFREQSKLHFHYDDPEMTCALQHGAVVFLGFEDGRVEIQSLKKRKCQKKFPATVVKLFVKDFDDGVVEDPAIRGLEVCELKNAHKLFIRTDCKLYQLLFKYPDSF